MSRLQKKKPTTGKKKKNPDGVKAASGEGTSVSSGVKAAAAASPKKAVMEKKSGDIKTGEPNFIQKAIEFVREVKVELKKVTWPTRKQTTGTTIVVIIFVFVVAAFLGLFDYSLSKLVQVVLT